MMRAGFVSLVRSTLLLLCLATPALAETRVALVIGNAAYKHAPALANPKNDAEGVAVSLRRLKFDVLLGVDLDEAGMRRLLREFAGKVEGLGKDDVALVFYAGHGLQVNGGNYLVPVDAKLEKESDLAFQAVSLDFLSKLLEQTPHTNIVILDACRDNPLARTLARGMGARSTGIGRGMAEMRGINDTLIVFATNPGNVALDGDTKNSPFTAALLAHIERPGLEVRHMVAEVRAAVIAATKGKQVPWESASLTRQIYFAPAAAPGATPAAPTPAPSPAPAPPHMPDNEALFWQSIKDSKNAADFKDYLARWPSGTFAELAKRRIAELEKAAVVTPPVPQKVEPPAPTRTSSWMVGKAHDNYGGLMWPIQNIASTQQCRALCLANPRCVAWDHLHTQPPEFAPSPERCRLYSTLSGKFSNNSLYIAGVIRTTPAAAPAQPAAPKPQPGATPASPAPTDQQAQVRELVRKAEAREAENGFCARVKWPDRGLALTGTEAGVHPPSGTGTIWHAAGRACGVWRGDGETNEGGFRVRSYTIWFCNKGERCFTSKFKSCRSKEPYGRGAEEWTTFNGKDHPTSIANCAR